MAKAKKVIGGCLITVIVLLALVAGGAFLFLNSYVGGNADSSLKQVLAHAENGKPYYTLLLGSDSRQGEAADSGARADVIILARVDPSTATATLISIPRDTLVTIDGYGANKINAAFNFGGAAGEVEAVSKLMGVEISHYAEVHFKELAQLVKAMGGVDVYVEERIDDPKAGTSVIEAGQQHLNGKQALVFARSRAYATGDFTRGNNQKILIKAIVDKMLSLPPTEMPGVLMAATECVTTDYSFNELMGLVMTFQRAKQTGENADKGLQFDDLGEAFGTVVDAVTGNSKLDIPTALALLWNYIMSSTPLGGDGPTQVTMYSATIPSIADNIGGASYVVCDLAGLKEMMDYTEAGMDPKLTKVTSQEASWLGDGYTIDDSHVPEFDTSPITG